VSEIITMAKKAADAWRNTDTYHQAAQIIDMLVEELEQNPTLTPPNEPLTCAGCYYLDRVCTPCAHCRRTAGYADYYLRPPEGEEDI
jgi:hypothetical protein